MVFDPTAVDGVLGNEYRADALGMQWRTNDRPYEILDDGDNIDRGGFFIPDKNWKTLREDWLEQSDADLDLDDPPAPFRRVSVEFRSGNVETGWWAGALTFVLLDPQKLYRRRWFKQLPGGRRIYFPADDYRDGTRGHVQLGVAILELLKAGLYVPVKVTLTGHASINVYAQPDHHGKQGYFHVAYGMARAWQSHFGQTRHVSMFPLRVVRGDREKVGAGQQSAFVHLPYPDFDALPDYNDADALKTYVGRMWGDKALFSKALDAENGLFVRWREEIAESFASDDSVDETEDDTGVMMSEESANAVEPDEAPSTPAVSPSTNGATETESGPPDSYRQHREAVQRIITSITGQEAELSALSSAMKAWDMPVTTGMAARLLSNLTGQQFTGNDVKENRVPAATLGAVVSTLRSDTDSVRPHVEAVVAQTRHEYDSAVQNNGHD